MLSKAKRYFSTSKLEALPGPGAYQEKSFVAEQLKKDKGFTWQKSRNLPKSLTPGPGSYSSNLTSSKYRENRGVVMAKAQRTMLANELKRASLTPGPGHNETSFDSASKFKSASASKFSKTKLPHFVKDEQSGEFINPEKLDGGRKSVPSFTISEAKRGSVFVGGKRSAPDVFYDLKDKTVRIIHF